MIESKYLVLSIAYIYHWDFFCFFYLPALEGFLIFSAFCFCGVVVEEGQKLNIRTAKKRRAIIINFGFRLSEPPFYSGLSSGFIFSFAYS